MNIPGRTARSLIRARLSALEAERVKHEQMIAAMVELLDAQQIALIKTLERLGSLTEGKA